jgi:hypothetical protein
VVRKIEGLAIDPRPEESRKLSGREAYRIRQGTLRVVYTIEEMSSPSRSSAWLTGYRPTDERVQRHTRKRTRAYNQT